MGDVFSGLAFQALGGPATGVDLKPLRPPTQKPNAATVSDAHKKVKIQREGFIAGEDPAATSMLVAEFDFVGSAADDPAQFLTLKKHVLGTPPLYSLPMTPGRGEKLNRRF
jgi:hypothetical protein